MIRQSADSVSAIEQELRRVLAGVAETSRDDHCRGIGLLFFQ